MARLIPMRLRIPQADATVFDRFAFYDYGTPMDPATVLAHAYGEVTGGVLDFRAQIARATTADALFDMRQMLSELREMVAEVEATAMDKMDAMGTGSAA